MGFKKETRPPFVGCLITPKARERWDAALKGLGLTKSEVFRAAIDATLLMAEERGLIAPDSDGAARTLTGALPVDSETLRAKVSFRFDSGRGVNGK